MLRRPEVTMLGQTVTLLCILFTIVPAMAAQPASMTSHPVHVYAGDDALITCVVRGAASSGELPSVIWARMKVGSELEMHREDAPREILTAGLMRVTSDTRVHVIHDAVGEVWVLGIRDVTPADSGLYVCEVANEKEPLRSFHKLSVLGRAASEEAPGRTSTAASVPRVHNFTACCIAANVSRSCLGFCDLQNIIDGNTGEQAAACESDFPRIVSCMADGRDHTACCAKEGVIDLCIDVCRGQYTPSTDSIKTHFSCDAYTERTLACIAQGIELLPSTPRHVKVDPISEHTLLVSWNFPAQNAHTVSQYEIEVRLVTSLDFPEPKVLDFMVDDSGFVSTEVFSSSTPSSVTTAAPPTSPPFKLQLKVPGTYNSSLVSSLKPFTMYEVSVTATNSHGNSLPSPAIRTLTLVPGQSKRSDEDVISGATPPPMPDVRACCESHGNMDRKCIDRLCDPFLTDVTDFTGLFECAPYAPVALKCLTGGQDHTMCCRARGIPELCRELCAAGNHTVKFDYVHLRCIEYVGIYSSCLLQSYGLLPSAPEDILVSNIHSDFAIIHWSPPKTLASTVKSYNVHYREVDGDGNDDPFRTSIDAQTPFILSQLMADSTYELYVQAVNEHGVGEPSQRIVFHTPALNLEEELEQEDGESVYNMTACCEAASLSQICMPLCSYNASVTDVRTLATKCASNFHTLLRCGAGGRDHKPCCERRGVPSHCMSLCMGALQDSLGQIAASCVHYVGNIVQCFEEGAGTLPGPVSELHAAKVNSSSVVLVWEAPPDDDGPTPDGFEVHYQLVGSNDTLQQALSVTNTTVTISSLTPGALYDFFVMSRNEHGSSLPSATLRINVTDTEVGEKGLAGVTSPPHGLSVAAHGATWLSLTWQPPYISHPKQPIKYRLRHRELNSSGPPGAWKEATSTVNSMMLEGLKPNTQYEVDVVAVTSQGESLPTETLLLWTDPAFPAFVEAPHFQPGAVIEGGSLTVLCIAMGTPAPAVSLYVSGKLVHTQNNTRHLVVVLHNVTREMRQVSCYADNGYGTPMQASRKVVVNFPPSVSTASALTLAIRGGSAVLECKVEAQPDPQTVFWRDASGRVPVVHGGRFEYTVKSVKGLQDTHLMSLTIRNTQHEDEGEYFCHAENYMGSSTQAVFLKIRPPSSTPMNATSCCEQMAVTAGCMDACSTGAFMDLDNVLDQPECVNDLYKMIRCAADGSDHRSCCTQRGLPQSCLNWCRGETMETGVQASSSVSTAPNNHKFCLLVYGQQIMACFQQGQDRLPGAPQRVRSILVGSHWADIAWDVPLRNPQAATTYRVFWRQLGSRTAMKNDSITSPLRIYGLKPSTTYECVVKAGNQFGSSMLSKPFKFSTASDEYITTSASMGPGMMAGAWPVGVAVGMAVVGVVAVLIVLAAAWLVRTKKLPSNATGRVAFENPGYLRELHMDNIPSTVLGGEDGRVQDRGWRHESLHAAEESASDLYRVSPSVQRQQQSGN